MNEYTKSTAALAAAVALSVGGLTACGKSDQTAGQQVDQTVASASEKTAEVRADAKEAGRDIKDATTGAMATGKQAANDAVITAAVNGALVKDPALSALRINVDTRDGKVMLSGTAPDAAAQTRATQLAQAVSGVQSVDNQLTVK